MTANRCWRLDADEVARCSGENGNSRVYLHLVRRLPRTKRPAGRIRPLNGVAIFASSLSPSPVVSSSPRDAVPSAYKVEESWTRETAGIAALASS